MFSFIVPPGRPLIHNERGILVESTLGPYNEGSKLRLTCSVSGGKIPFIIHSYCFEISGGLLQKNSIWVKMHLNYPIYYSGIGFVRLSVKLMFLTKQIKSSTFAWPKNYAVHKFWVHKIGIDYHNSWEKKVILREVHGFFWTYFFSVCVQKNGFNL